MQKIFAAFVKAQRAFGPALKTSKNPHFKSSYADLSACVEAVIDGLNDAGIALVQQCHECDDGVIVETVFLHESGETFSAGKLHVPASKKDPQGYGSALTYARRYSLMAACGIAPEDDDGNAASKLIHNPIKHSPVQSVGVNQDRMSLIVDTSESIKERFAADDVIGAYELASEWTDVEEKQALWKLLPSNIRSAIKAHSESLKGKS